MKVDINKAKSQLAKLVMDAGRGNDVIITQNGQAVAKLVALKEQKLSARKNRNWSNVVLDFEGVDEIKAFESFRDYSKTKE